MNPTARTMDELLLHERFVQRLARSLLCIDADADDLVQETWLLALEHPPDSGGRAVGWLGTVTRNLARNWNLGAFRRREREILSARQEGTPPLQQVAEREEVRRQIVEALGRIAEDHASAIVLRFFEDLPPRDIARRLSVPVETVKKRLTRGLAELRQELDGAFEGGRRGWVAALPILIPAREGTAVAATTLKSFLGALLVSTTAKLLCTLGVVAIVAVFAVRMIPNREPVPGSSIVAPRPDPEVSDARSNAPQPAPIPHRAFEEPPGEPRVAQSKAPNLPARPSGQTFVVGRLVGEDGAPFKSRWIKATEVARGDGRQSSHGTPNVELDAEGRFRIALEEAFQGQSAGASRTLIFLAIPVRNFGRAEPAEPAYGAKIDLSRELPAGDCDLGNVVMKLAPLIASGIVVDPGGQPVSGARVTFGIERGAESRLTVVEIGNEMDRLRDLVVDSTADGTFEIRGFVDASSVKVRAAKTGWKDSARVNAAVGATGVRLSLGAAGGTLRGKVLVDAGIPLSLVVIEYHLSSLPRGLGAFTGRCEADGTFEYQSDGAETLQVVVGTVGVDEPLAEVSGIQLSGGETIRDPRLDPLDLRGRLRLVRVTVADPDLRPVSSATVFVERGANARSEYGVDVDGDGRASLLMQRAAVDLRVEAAGFRTGRIPRVMTDTQVVMRRSLTADFAFVGQLRQLPKGVTAKVSLVPVDERIREQRRPEDDFLRHLLDKRGHVRNQAGSRASILQTRVEFELDSQWSAASIAIPEPRTFEVELHLERKFESGSTGFQVSFPAPPRIAVKDEEGRQAVSCDAPPAAEVDRVTELLRK